MNVPFAFARSYINHHRIRSANTEQRSKHHNLAVVD
jgi:hypothetical protein